MNKKLLLVAACTMSLFLTACSKKEKQPSDFDMTDVKKEPQQNTDNTSTVSDELNLTAYQKQSIVTAINNKLSSMYDSGTYGWVSIDSLALSKDSDGNVIAETDLNRTDGGNQYSTPAKFTLVFDSSSNSFSIKDENVDTGTTETLNKDNSNNSAKKDQLPTNMSEADSFDVTVSTGITITLDTSSGGHGAAYAVSDSGHVTLLCDAQSESKTETVSLAGGHYTIKMYAEEGTHYSWQYNAY